MKRRMWRRGTVAMAMWAEPRGLVLGAHNKMDSPSTLGFIITVLLDAAFVNLLTLTVVSHC
jgi:hypothetical protein